VDPRRGGVRGQAVDAALGQGGGVGIEGGHVRPGCTAVTRPGTTPILPADREGRIPGRRRSPKNPPPGVVRGAEDSPGHDPPIRRPTPARIPER
jgi:hypothetical protein